MKSTSFSDEADDPTKTKQDQQTTDFFFSCGVDAGHTNASVETHNEERTELVILLTLLTGHSLFTLFACFRNQYHHPFITTTRTRSIQVETVVNYPQRINNHIDCFLYSVSFFNGNKQDRKNINLSSFIRICSKSKISFF